MADKGPKLDIKANKPKLSKFKVAGKTLRDAHKNLNKRAEWGLYDATRNAKSSAKVDKDRNVMSVTMVLNPVIEMPAWSGYAAATKAQKASWDSMYKALLKHENKHHEIQQGCIDDLKKAIQAAKSLDAAALNKIIADSQAACQKKQDAYDSKSGHGAKEGVELDLDA